MRARRRLGWLLIAAPALSGQEPLGEPLLVGHLSTREHTTLRSPTAVRETTPLAKEKESSSATPFVLSLWSPQKVARAAANAAASPTTAAAAAAPGVTMDLSGHRFAFAFREQKPLASQATPLPRNLPWTMFTHSRVRGPFEQVYALIW